MIPERNPIRKIPPHGERLSIGDLLDAEKMKELEERYPDQEVDREGRPRAKRNIDRGYQSSAITGLASEQYRKEAYGHQ